MIFIFAQKDYGLQYTLRKLQKYFVGEVIWSKFIVIQRKNNIYELRVEFVITHDIEPVKWAL